VLGLLIAPDIRLALGVFKGWVADPLLLMCLLFITYQRTSNQKVFLQNVVGSLLMGAAVTSLVALTMGLTQSLDRLAAWYDSPNVLAMYLVPVAVAGCLWLYTEHLAERAVWPRAFWWYGALGLVIVSIIGTGSYGALLGLFLSLAVGWLYSSASRQKLARVMAVSLALVGLILPWGMVMVGEWRLPSHQNATYNVTSGQVRLVLWREGAKLIAKEPLLGVGLGQWQPVFNSQIRPYLSEIKNPGYAIELYYASLFPHNLWLATWLSLGFVGVLALGLLCWCLYRSPVGPYTAVAAAMFTAVLTQGWFDTPAFKNDLSVLFLLPLLLFTCQNVQPQLNSTYGTS
jgi:O-antigen ligase